MRIHKMPKQQKHNRLNQKGMTLVEVITAMTILAIVVAPTLKIFASTSGTNLRAKRQQRATSVGESVMENFKAFTLTKVTKDFTDGSFMSSIISDGSTTSYDVDVKDLAGATIPDTDIFQENGRVVYANASKYVYTINNAKSEGVYYDVVATVTPSSGYFADNLYSAYDISEYRDCIIPLDSSMNAKAYSEMVQKAKTALASNLPAGATSYTVSDVEIKNFTRVIDIEVADNGYQKVVVKATYTCEATVNYTYTTGAGVGGVSVQSGSKSFDSSVMEVKWRFPDNDPTQPEEFMFYDNTSTMAGSSGALGRLGGIYLYYYPNYEGTMSADAERYGDGAKDVINLKGKSTQPLSFYVVKQKMTSFSNPGTYGTADYHYNANVNNTVEMSAGSTTDVTLYTNLTENISGYSGAAVPTFNYSHTSGFAKKEPLVKAVQGRANRLYDVEVKVCEAGETNELAVFTGTINE